MSNSITVLLETARHQSEDAPTDEGGGQSFIFTGYYASHYEYSTVKLGYFVIENI